MNILALTFGPPSAGSSFYRIFQYIEPLAQDGIHLNAVPADSFKNWDTLARYDIVIIQKRLLRGRLVNLIRRRARNLIFDIDDAIWEPHGRKHRWLTRWRTNRRLRCIVEAADLCMVANDLLAAKLCRYSKCVEVVPMALNESVWKPDDGRKMGPVRIGWAGAPVNLPYLSKIESSLMEIQLAHPGVEIVIFCGHSPEFQSALQVTHIPFRQGDEPDIVRSFDIGLLPLPNNSFAAGKSPIKGLQYMACGVATVVSPLGATMELFNSGGALFADDGSEWSAALLRLIKDSELRRRLGHDAHISFHARHTRVAVAAKLSNLFRSIAEWPR